MNKTISINLGGVFFHIEEDAYEHLDHYLEDISHYFEAEDGGKEIVEDIEGRIAEMFQEFLKKHRRQVILLGDVETTISIMGHPEEFGEPIAASSTHSSGHHTTSKGSTASAFQEEEDEEEDEDIDFGQAQRSRKSRKKYRRLYRNGDDKVLGGVCSGLSAYFGISDPIWMRLLFAFSLVVLGHGFWVYILLWIIIKEAKTSAEKLAMRGEPINISNIEKTFKDSVGNFKTHFNEFNETESGRKTRFFFRQFTNLAKEIVPLLGYLLMKLVKVAVVILAIVLIFTLASALFGLFVAILSSAKFLLSFIFTSILPVAVTAISAFLTVVIPILFISYFLLKTFFKVKIRNRKLGRALGILWILSLVSVLAMGSNTYTNNFSSVGEIQTSEALTQASAEALHINLLNNDFVRKVNMHNQSKVSVPVPLLNLDKAIFDYDSKNIFVKNVQLSVEKSEQNTLRLLKTASAIGGSTQSAQETARQIEYVYEQQDSSLAFSPYYATPTDNKWRNQQLSLVLEIPVGQKVYFSKKLKPILRNNGQTKLVGKKWIMTENGLERIKSSASTVAKENSQNGTNRSNVKLEGSTQKTFPFKDFSKINLQGKFDVDIMQGDSYKVVFSGHPKDVEKVRIHQRGAELKVDFNWNWFGGSQKEELQALIILPRLTQLELSGMCQSNVSGFEIDKLDVELSGLSTTDIAAEVEQLNVEVSGASELRLKGAIDQLNLDASGASNIKAFNSEIDKATLEVSGASSAELLVKNSLTADLSGASTLRYKGQPSDVETETSGAASIVAMD